MNFPTSATSTQQRVVSVLEELYAGSPVGSVAIGAALPMEHRQVLKDLHAAHDEATVAPIYSSPGGAVRGWVPAKHKPIESLAEQRARQAAAVVRKLTSKSKCISARTVARKLNAPEGTVARWLKYAEHMKLVRSRPRRGWMPA